MSAYYNEIEPFAAQWLRNLIARNLIAPGDVDERSIIDVQPDDLRGYTQCHFFAGIGGWSYALRLAGWADSRSVWTGSCPCQPFSSAGSQRGSDDERHLWPAFFRLIRECRPAAIFGEQVAGAAGLAWLDHVCADLEDIGYAAAAADLCAAGVGAPHIRQRLYWMADAKFATGRQFQRISGEVGGTSGVETTGRRQPTQTAAHRGADGWLADADRAGSLLGECDAEAERGRESDREAAFGNDADGRGEVCGMGNASKPGSQGRERPGDVELHGAAGSLRSVAETGVLDAWSDLEWLPCSDGKSRPTEPGLFPLAHGIPGLLGRLRAYGNAIVPQIAAAFITASMLSRRGDDGRRNQRMGERKRNA